MKPVIILDKSTLHSIGFKYLPLLRTLFLVNIPQILLYEIISDLTKNSLDNPETTVQQNACKILGSHYCINEGHHSLINNSLLGYDYFDSSQVIVPEFSSRGSFNLALERWSKKDFNDDDYQVSENWRPYKDKQNSRIQQVYDGWNQILKSEEGGRSLFSKIAPEIISKVIDLYLSTFDIKQSINLLYLYNEIDEMLLPAILERNKKGSLKNKSPYAYYFLGIYYAYTFGLSADYIKHNIKSSSFIDTYYMYYLPFCNVFSSGDSDHKALFEILRKKNQVFLASKDLINDLVTLSKYFEENNLQLDSIKMDDIIKFPELYKTRVYEVFLELNQHQHRYSSLGLQNFLNYAKHNQSKSSPNCEKLNVEESGKVVFDKLMANYKNILGVTCLCGSNKLFIDCCFNKYKSFFL